jgi:hypothetical protein
VSIPNLRTWVSAGLLVDTSGGFPLLPAIDVRSGTDIGNGILGVLSLPVISTVEQGVQYGANSTEFTGTLNGYVPKFKLGDIIYGIDDIQRGKLIPLIVVSTDIQVNSVEAAVITYTVRNNQKFTGTQYEESELMTHDEAKTLATAQLNQNISVIQGEIANL